MSLQPHPWYLYANTAAADATEPAISGCHLVGHQWMRMHTVRGTVNTATWASLLWK